MSDDKKFIEDSLTPSTRLLNEMIGKSNTRRMLTEEEISLLRKSAKEISEKIQSLRKKNDPP